MSANDYYNRSGGGYYPPQSGTFHVTQAQVQRTGIPVFELGPGIA